MESANDFREGSDDSLSIDRLNDLISSGGEADCKYPIDLQKEKAVPYSKWGIRKAGKMTVWIKKLIR
jgi:hypothetical protein